MELTQRPPQKLMARSRSQKTKHLASAYAGKLTPIARFFLTRSNPISVLIGQRFLTKTVDAYAALRAYLWLGDLHPNLQLNLQHKGIRLFVFFDHEHSRKQLMKLTRLTYALATAGFTSTLLIACGGGGGDTVVTPPTVVQPPAALTFLTTGTSFVAGESISLSDLKLRAESVSMVFENDGSAINLPIMDKNSVIAPVLPSALAGQPVRLLVQTASGAYKSNLLRVSGIPLSTTLPGSAAAIYLEASIAHLQSAIDELVTISGDAANPEAAEVASAMRPLVTLRNDILAAQASSSAVVIAKSQSGEDLRLDAEQMRMLDQYVLALINITTQPSAKKASASSASGETKRAVGITTLNCAGLDPSTKAFCTNMQTQLASDYLINYTGMAAAAGTTAAGILGALAAAGATTLATPALLIGGASLGALVLANAIGAGVQGASAVGTGTTAGINIRENVKNITDAARDFTIGQLSRLLPTNGSALIGELNGAVTGYVADKFFDRTDKLLVANTRPVVNCTAVADSGGRGSFARRYDFSAGKTITLSYDAFNIPDEFTVFDSTGQVAGTGGLVSGRGTLTFTSASRTVTVKVNAPTANTSWNFSIACAN